MPLKFGPIQGKTETRRPAKFFESVQDYKNVTTSSNERVELLKKLLAQFKLHYPQSSMIFATENLMLRNGLRTRYNIDVKYILKAIPQEVRQNFIDVFEHQIQKTMAEMQHHHQLPPAAEVQHHHQLPQAARLRQKFIDAVHHIQKTMPEEQHHHQLPEAARLPQPVRVRQEYVRPIQERIDEQIKLEAQKQEQDARMDLRLFGYGMR